MHLYNTVSQSCEDVLNCDHFCINGSSGFKCACRHGYILALDGRTCQGMLNYVHNCSVTASEYSLQILMSVFYHTTTVMIMLLAIIPKEALPALVMKDIMAVVTSVLVSSNEYLTPKCHLYGHF